MYFFVDNIFYLKPFSLQRTVIEICSKNFEHFMWSKIAFVIYFFK